MKKTTHRSGFGVQKRARICSAIGVVTLALMASGVSGSEVRRVAQVRVEGSRVVSEERVVAWLGIRREAVWSERAGEMAGERVLEAYRDRGYWNAEIEGREERETASGLVVVFGVREGGQTRVGTVGFSGELPVPLEQLKAIVDTRKGDPLRRGSLQGDAEALMDLFERIGYPYAAIVPDVRIAPGASVVNVVWGIDAGPRVSIDAVRFSGLVATKVDVLLRESGLVTGGVYDQRVVDEATRVLRRLPWLLAVADPVIEQDARTGRYAIHYAVQEAKSTTIEGGVGLLPRVDGSYSWVGRIRFESDNLGGSGRGAGFFWDRPVPSSSDLQIWYMEPWLLGKPFRGQASVEHRQRPGFVESGLTLGIAYRPAPDTEVSVSLERTTVRPDSVEIVSFGHQGIWSVGGAIDWDRRDRRRLPTRGWRVRGSGTWDTVTDDDWKSEFSRIRYQVATSLFRPVNEQTTLGLRVQSEGLIQDQEPGPNALIRVGGSRTLRGYVEEHFLVEHAVWANLAILRDLGRGARAYLFGDGGVLRPPASVGTGWIRAVGYGAGLQTQTRTGMITIEYGLSKDDSPGQGKIHVRLEAAR